MRSACRGARSTNLHSTVRLGAAPRLTGCGRSPAVGCWSPSAAAPCRRASASAVDATTLRQDALDALAYLSTQQLPDGSLDDRASETEDFILGTVAAGRDPNNLISSAGNSVYDFLAANLGSATSDANRTGKLVQAVVAGRHDPTTFGGTNLLALLEGPGAAGGGFYNPQTGAFATGRDAAFSQANAMLGLLAAGDPGFPVAPAAAAYLDGLQVVSAGPEFGGWTADGVANTNSTAMALMALSAVHDSGSFASAFVFLHGQQDLSSGGFVFTNLGGFASSTSDPDSDALVIQGLVATGQDPGSATWANTAGTALTDIVTFQNANGGFSFQHGTAPNAFTTSFVPAGLLEAPFPILPA